MRNREIYDSYISTCGMSMRINIIHSSKNDYCHILSATYYFVFDLQMPKVGQWFNEPFYIWFIVIHPIPSPE